MQTVIFIPRVESWEEGPPPAAPGDSAPTLLLHPGFPTEPQGGSGAARESPGKSASATLSSLLWSPGHGAPVLPRLWCSHLELCAPLMEPGVSSRKGAVGSNGDGEPCTRGWNLHSLKPLCGRPSATCHLAATGLLVLRRRYCDGKLPTHCPASLDTVQQTL